MTDSRRRPWLRLRRAGDTLLRMSIQRGHAVPGGLERGNPRERRGAGRRVVWVFLLLGAALLALSTVVMAMLLNEGTPLGIALPASILVGGVVGAVNGMGIALLGIQPFIMTLATMVMVRGVALRLSEGAPQPFTADSPIVDFFGSGDLGPIPGPVVIFMLIAVAGWALLRYLPFGRFLYAIGGSKEGVCALVTTGLDQNRRPP